MNEIQTWEFVKSLPEDNEITKKYSCNPPDVYGFGHSAYYEHIINCLTKNQNQIVDGHEGRKSVLLINAIYKSIETGNEVFISDTPVSGRLGVVHE